MSSTLWGKLELSASALNCLIDQIFRIEYAIDDTLTANMHMPKPLGLNYFAVGFGSSISVRTVPVPYCVRGGGAADESTAFLELESGSGRDGFVLWLSGACCKLRGHMDNTLVLP